MSRLAHRVAKLERRNLPPPSRYPSIVEVREFDGETESEAFDRLIAKYGQPPKGHGFIVVPAQPANPEQIAACEAMSIEAQRRLKADARSLRPTDTIQ